MRFTTAAAAVLISGGIALAQQTKEPVVHVRPAPGISVHRSGVAPPVTRSKASSAAELARIEQHPARVRSNKTVAHHPSGSVTATPALDLGKNKAIRASRSRQPSSPNGH